MILSLFVNMAKLSLSHPDCSLSNKENSLATAEKEKTIEEKLSEKIRKATNEYMASIYEMGYETQGDNMPPEEYFRMCGNSGK